MVHHVVAHVPQAVGRERGQKGDAAQPFVQPAVRRQALVAAVVADDEQPADDKAGRQPAQQLQPDRFQQHHAGHQRRQQQVVDASSTKARQVVRCDSGQQPGTDDLAVRQRRLRRQRAGDGVGAVVSGRESWTVKARSGGLKHCLAGAAGRRWVRACRFCRPRRGAVLTRIKASAGWAGKFVTRVPPAARNIPARRRHW